MLCLFQKEEEVISVNRFVLQQIRLKHLKWAFKHVFININKYIEIASWQIILSLEQASKVLF